MKYTLIPPPASLSALVKHFWVCTWDAQAGQGNTSHYVVANSSTELTFAFDGQHKDAELLFSIVQGHTHRPGQFAVPPFQHLLGVSFHSAAIPTLFGISPAEMTNASDSLAALLGAEGDRLNEKIALAGSAQERIAILSAHFTSLSNGREKEDLRIAQAVQEIRRSGGNLRIDRLADRFCLSQKQFGRRFKAFSGFTPKLYARIIRFESVLTGHQSGQSLTETAFAHGYFDQAHFIHELQSFTGFKPTDFWKLGEGSL